MQIDETLEVVGQFGAMRRKAARIGVAFDIMRVTDVIDAGQSAAKGSAVVDEPADADPAKARAMIAALAPDQPGTRPLPPRPLDIERDFQRGIDRFRSAIGEEYPVEPFGHQRGHALRQFERQRMAQLERRRKLERRRGFGNGLADFRGAMTGIATP